MAKGWGEIVRQFQQWLEEFLQGKKEIPVSDEKHAAVHSVRCFSDSSGRLWEIAFTYTGRLVVRTGQVSRAGNNVSWEPWATQHDVEVPPKEKR